MPQAPHSSGNRPPLAARPLPSWPPPTPRHSRRPDVQRGNRRSLARNADGLGELLADTLVDAGREARALILADTVEIEHVLLAPIAHHLKPREHIHIVYVADPMKRVQVALKVDDGHRAPRELHIDEHDVDAARPKFINPALQRSCELLYFDTADGVGGARLPDHQDRILGNHVAWKPFQHLLRGLSGDALVDDRDRNARVPKAEHFLQAMRISEVGGTRRGARGRGASDSNDLDRATCPQPLVQMRQRLVDPHQLVRYFALPASEGAGRTGDCGDRQGTCQM